MKYDDFSLPNDDELKLMNNFYNNFSIDKNTIISFCLSHLHESINICLGANSNLNKKLLLKIEEIKPTLISLIENISLISNKKEKTIHQPKNFNIFQLLYNLDLCIDKLLSWHKEELKENTKFYILKTIKSLSSCQKALHETLSQLNIKFYKFM